MYTHAVVMVECKMFVIVLQTGKNSVCVYMYKSNIRVFTFIGMRTFESWRLRSIVRRGFH